MTDGENSKSNCIQKLFRRFLEKATNQGSEQDLQNHLSHRDIRENSDKLFKTNYWDKWTL
jgi:hypothetical protein